MKAIGAVLVLMGVGTLIFVLLTAVMNLIPPRSTRLENFAEKEAQHQPLSNSERLEADQVRLERYLPIFAVSCLLIGFVVILIG